MKKTVFDTYNGGKGNCYQHIINEIPKHDVWIVPFLGNCAVTRYMRTTDTAILIDASCKVITKWKEAKALENAQYITGNGIEYLENLERFKIFQEYNKRVVIYLDPPYLQETRYSQKNLYEFEIKTPEAHERILKALLALEERFSNISLLISTYPNSLYKKYLKNWRIKEFEATTRKGKRIEHLYMNFPTPEELHDYQYMGDDYRERERIKRKAKRWLNGLLRLPEQERQTILKEIEKIYTVATPKITIEG